MWWFWLSNEKGRKIYLWLLLLVSRNVDCLNFCWCIFYLSVYMFLHSSASPKVWKETFMIFKTFHSYYPLALKCMTITCAFYRASRGYGIFGRIFPGCSNCNSPWKGIWFYLIAVVIAFLSILVMGVVTLWCTSCSNIPSNLKKPWRTLL